VITSDTGAAELNDCMNARNPSCLLSWPSGTVTELGICVVYAQFPKQTKQLTQVSLSHACSFLETIERSLP
jgi:hypothetical protein